MPTLTELIDYHGEFEPPRGLDKQSIHERLNRMSEEIDEVWEALREGNNIAVVQELADVVIMISSVVLHILDEMDLPREYFEEYTAWKLTRNSEKYSEEYFGIGGLPNAEANMRRAKHIWNNGEVDGNDYY